MRPLSSLRYQRLRKQNISSTEEVKISTSERTSCNIEQHVELFVEGWVIARPLRSDSKWSQHVT